MKTIIQICNDLNNVGDLLAPIITEKIFGYKVHRVFKDIPSSVENERVLGGLGSFLGYYGSWNLDVWGSGFEPGYVDRHHSKYPGSRSRWVVHAVRGPVTREILKLDDNVAIGDPALLMPKIYFPKKVNYEQVRYFTHYDTPENVTAKYYCPTFSTRMPPFKAIDLITSSDLVLSESLHISILAHAYGIPWAWAFNVHTRGMVKWFDWFASIGANPAMFRPNQKDKALEWHQSQSFKAINTEKLLDCFPHYIAY